MIKVTNVYICTPEDTGSRHVVITLESSISIGGFFIDPNNNYVSFPSNFKPKTIDSAEYVRSEIKKHYLEMIKDV